MPADARVLAARWFRLSGGSMFPALRDGDLVEASAVPFEQLRPGQILLFENPGGRWVAHRLIRRRWTSAGWVLTTKGDTCFRSDPPVDVEKIAGRVLVLDRAGKVRRFEGTLARFQEIGWLLLSVSVLPSVYRLSRFLRWSLKRPVFAAARRLQILPVHRRMMRRRLRGILHYDPVLPYEAKQIERFYAAENPLPQWEAGEAFPVNPDEQRPFVQYTYWAHRSGKCLGAVMLGKDPPAFGKGWWLFGMKVHWLYRGCGIGEGLLTYLLDQARRRGIDQIFLRVDKGNHAARGLYQKFGFEGTGEERCAEWVMARRLRELSA